MFHALRHLYLVDLVLFALGLALALFVELMSQGAPDKTPVYAVLSKLGLAAVISGCVSAMIRATHPQPKSPAPCVLLQRKGYSPLKGHYLDRVYRSTNMDMLGVLAREQLRRISGKDFDKMLEHVKLGLTIRILILDPRSDYVITRADEVYEQHGEVFRTLIMKSVKMTDVLYGKLAQVNQKLQFSNRGGIEVRVTRHPHSLWMYRTDGSILWGIYSSSISTLDSRVLEITRDSDVDFFDELINHFETLWNRHSSGGCLIRYRLPHSDLYRNEGLFRELYDSYGEPDID